MDLCDVWVLRPGVPSSHPHFGRWTQLTAPGHQQPLERNQALGRSHCAGSICYFFMVSVRWRSKCLMFVVGSSASDVESCAVDADRWHLSATASEFSHHLKCKKVLPSSTWRVFLASYFFDFCSGEMWQPVTRGIPGLPHPRSTHCAVRLVGTDRVFLYGGMNQGPLSDTWY